ncbi:MAG: hypothetical protein ACTTJ3_06315 [Treponema sp.]
MKNRFYILIILVLLVFTCTIDKTKKYQNGNYCFKYLGNKSVCFCGWSKEAVKQSKGAVYVPEKIYDFNVVEVGIYYGEDFFDDSFSVSLEDIKSIICPSYITTVRLDKYRFHEGYYWGRELCIPEGITDISTKALETFNNTVSEIILPCSLKRIDCHVFDGEWQPNQGWNKSLKFQDTANWYIRKQTETSWQPIDVSNPSINAENIVNKYSSYIWEKRP